VSKSRPVPGPLSVEADLSVSVDQYDYRINGAGDRLVIEAPSLPAAVALVRLLPDAGDERLLELLETADLAADISVRDTHVASVGAGVESSALARPLGGLPADVRPSGVGTVTAKELRARPLTLIGLVVLIVVLRWFLSNRGDESAVSPE
jgi:hypothetical protein